MSARSLADVLRGWSDDDLTALLVVRPDLVSPLPADLTGLATRAGTRASVARALDSLDRFALQVVDGLVHLPDPTTHEDLRLLLDVPDETLRPAVDRLRRLCLLWAESADGPQDSGDELHLVRTVREIIGSPAGLGPPAETALAAYPAARLRDLLTDLRLDASAGAGAAATAVAGLLADRDALDALLSRANDPTSALLEELAWGAPVRRVAGVRRDVRAGEARTAVEWLVAHALLVVTAVDTVVLPREVGLHLRRGRLHARLEPDAPPLETIARDPDLVDRTAAGAAFTAVRDVENLLEAWSLDGPPVLRAGGLGVRELRRAAAAHDMSEATLALYAEAAYAAGLLAPSDDVDQVWLPSPAYDAWLRRPAQERWCVLASTWLASTRVAGLVGARDERDKPVSALGPEVDHARAPDVRRAVLTALADLAPGEAASGDSIAARLRWEHPRRAGSVAQRLVAWTLAEAETLGVTGQAALAAFGRSLLAGDEPAAGASLESLLPEPVDHVLLQADLTAVAPGPLTADLAREIALAADVESTGGATVYRFREASVRRALDAGRTAAELHTLLATHSRTPVPQPLTYLVDDVSRRHGHVRVGAASAYVRCDDETVLAELLADRRAGSLRLRRLAPTVLAAQSPVDVLLERLRGMGLAPMAESPDGDVVVTRADARRSAPRHPPARLSREPAPNAGVLAAAVRALRAGERASSAPRRDLTATAATPARAGGLPRTATAETVATLQDAAENGRSVWIGYVDNSGSASERIVDALRVEGGHLTAYDHRTEQVRSFAVHRVTGVAALDDSSTG